MEYMTAEEIAAKLRVDISTVRRLIRSGQLPSIRVGRQYRIERTAYEQFLKNREVSSQEQNPKANDLVFAH
jgi:excisionase family DNA binding protein